MNVIELIKEKLEEEKTHQTFSDKEVGFNKGIRKAISIVDEVAQEYRSNAWLEIYDKVLQLEKRCDAEQNTEGVNDCIKLQNLLNYFKQELYEDNNNGWIACGERLPDKDNWYCTTVKCGDMYETGNIKFVNGEWEMFNKEIKVVAWMERPAPYKEGGTE